MAWLNGRYGNYSADPLLNVGADARFGAWQQGPLFFPMQAQVYAALHPVEHLTFMTSVAARGRMRRLLMESDRDGQTGYGVRDLWVMAHELPFMSYARAGRFRPAFGTRVADHTAYTRRPFGHSQEDLANEVVGLEVGAAPNYPYITASGFKTSTLEAKGPFDLGEGWGGAVKAGWRDMGWQVGTSAMIRRRPLEEGDNTTDLSINWAWNPWRYWNSARVTYLGEAPMVAYCVRFQARRPRRLLSTTSWLGLGPMGSYFGCALTTGIRIWMWWMMIFTGLVRAWT